jgi:hypothetical protein
MNPWELVRAAFISLAANMFATLMGSSQWQGWYVMLTIVLPTAVLPWTHLRIRIGVALYLCGVAFYTLAVGLPRGLLRYGSPFGILATILQVLVATAPALLGLAVAHLITRPRVVV